MIPFLIKCGLELLEATAPAGRGSAEGRQFLSSQIKHRLFHLVSPQLLESVYICSCQK